MSGHVSNYAQEISSFFKETISDMARKLSSLSISECWNFLAAGGIIILRGEDGMFFLS